MNNISESALILIILIAAGIDFLYEKFKTRGKKTKRKKKHHDPRNNYFRNNPEHIDMTDKYIDNMWDELK